MEGDEVFQLVIYTPDLDIVIASDHSTATIVIVDNDGELESLLVLSQHAHGHTVYVGTVHHSIYSLWSAVI